MTTKTAIALILISCLFAWGCDAETKNVDSCGDNFLDPGEECDGSQLTVNTCTDLGYYDQLAPLRCLDNCTFDLTVCSGGRCGDGNLQVDKGEKCDGENLDDMTCSTLGLGGGTLACKVNCRFDVSRCELAAECGDGVAASPYEPCDGADLDDQTCESQGFFKGTLACMADCGEFDTSGCSNCGNGAVDTGEQCDGTNLNDQTCAGRGYSGGALSCTAMCAFDLSQCEAPVTCGNGQLETDEQCDGTDLNGATCQTQGFFGGQLGCRTNCAFDTTGCSNCGNDQLDDGEICENSNLAGATCVSQGYSARGGVLGCTAACSFNTTDCIPNSSNANLASMTVSSGALSPIFSSSIVSYSVTVPLEVTSLAVAGTAEDAPYATVAVTPAQPMVLVVGTASTATVTVTAEDGTEKAYTVTVTRQATNDYSSPNIGTLIYVPGGTFQRDATATNLSTVSAFRMSSYEITRAQWTAVTGWADPSDVSKSSGPSDPVQRVNWYHAIAFCNKLSLLEGLTPVYAVSGVDFSTLTYAEIPMNINATWNAATANWASDGYRLPTEMEWMWAAMGADMANPGAVNTTGYTKAFAGSTGSNLIGDYAVFGFGSGQAGATTTDRSNPVGSKLANELGFYDLSGNVWEWVWDWYNTYPTGTVTNYQGPVSGSSRMRRGGSRGGDASGCTVDYRIFNDPDLLTSYGGFRVVRL